MLSLEDREDVGQEAAKKMEASVKKEAEGALYDVLAAEKKLTLEHKRKRFAFTEAAVKKEAEEALYDVLAAG